MLSLILLVSCASFGQYAVNKQGVFGLGTEEDPQAGKFLKLLEPGMEPKYVAEESDALEPDLEGKFEVLDGASELRSLTLSSARLDIILSDKIEVVHPASADAIFPDEMFISRVNATTHLSDNLYALTYLSDIHMNHQFVKTDLQCSIDTVGPESCRVYERESSGVPVVAQVVFEGNDLEKLRDILTLNNGDKSIEIYLQFYGEYLEAEETDADQFVLRPSYYDQSRLVFNL